MFIFLTFIQLSMYNLEPWNAVSQGGLTYELFIGEQPNAL
ncbi:hypothetical protein D1AOALGA4SA_5262 [Olavius algarvensis Delta 1 endosymbiont]|nr:hypothetical protein D1AOALGA4SA_5262 [Olavius algarvensis Delta 1 endosymbiont]